MGWAYYVMGRICGDMGRICGDVGRMMHGLLLGLQYSNGPATYLFGPVQLCIFLICYVVLLHLFCSIDGPKIIYVYSLYVIFRTVLFYALCFVR
jgi:hypothetical protein